MGLCARQFGTPASRIRMLVTSGNDAARMLTTAVVAFAVQYAGLLAERWFSFAEANHAHNPYYHAAS